MSSKRLFILIGIITTIAIGGFVVANQQSCDAKSGQCDSATQTATSSDAQNQIDKINQDIANGAILVDVRETTEFSQEHAENATNVPLGQIQTGHFPTNDRNTKIYLYCHSGKRATSAAEILKTAGYNDVTVLGGLTDWQQMGGAVVQ